MFLIVISSIKQAKLFLSSLKVYDAVLCADKIAKDYLKLNNINVLDIYDYADESNLQSLGIEILEIAKNKLYKINRLYDSKYLNPEKELILGYHFFFRILLNQIYPKINLINRFLDSNYVESVTLYQQEDIKIPWYLVAKQKDFWASVFELVAKKRGISIINIPYKSNEKVNNTLSIKQYFFRIANKLNINSVIPKNILKKKRILLLGDLIEFKPLKMNLDGYFLDDFNMDGELLTHRKKSLFNYTKKINSGSNKYYEEIISEFNEEFIYEGVNCYDLIKPYIYTILESLTQNIIPLFHYFEKYFRMNSITSILRGPLTNPFFAAVIIAARANNIKVRTLQHGGNYGYVDLPYYKYTDLLWSDTFLVWGDKAKEYFESKYSLQNGTCIYSVGTMRFQNYNKLFNNQTNSNQFLYVPTAFMGNYLCYDRQNIPDFKYYEFQKKLINYFEETRIPLSIKLYMSQWAENPIEDIYKYYSYQYVSFIRNGKLNEYLKNFNNIIIDWPSTTILECLNTDKRVFLILDEKWTKIDYNAYDKLKKSVVIISSIYELNKFINKPSHTTSMEIEARNDFLLDYACNVSPKTFVANIKNILT